MESSWAQLDDQYRKNKDLKKSDIELLKEWLKMQPHLPPITEMELVVFHHSCYYRNEATKKCIDNYFTARTHAPELFKDTDPFGKEITQTIDKIHIVPLPKLTPEGYGILYSRLADPNPDVYNFSSQTKLFGMLMHLWLKEVGCLNGIIFMMDMTGGSIGHLSKVSLVTLKKVTFFVQQAIPVRIKGIYYVNPIPLIDKVMILLKPFINKELQQVFKVLPPKELAKQVSADLLPAEIGGTLGPIIDIKGNQLEKLRKNAEYFRMDENRTTDETKRPGKPKDSGELFGVEGTFKKLDID